MEKWEPISADNYILVSKEHCFNTDTILLANFSAPKKNYLCADFGTGCGTIAFLWKIRQNPRQIFAIELQEKAYSQAKQSLERNNFDNFNLINDNINNYKAVFTAGSLDLVACNPPYKASGAGLKNPVENMRIARHEDELSLEDLAKAVSFSLKFGGKFCICQRPERLTDCMDIFRKNGLEPKRLRLVQQRKDKKAFLFLLECRRGGNSGLEILPTLFVEENGEFSKEMLEIYGNYKTIN
ncbi:MAG: methyltransferase [Clostridia bacterium]